MSYARGGQCFIARGHMRNLRGPRIALKYLGDSLPLSLSLHAIDPNYLHHPPVDGVMYGWPHTAGQGHTKGRMRPASPTLPRSVLREVLLAPVKKTKCSTLDSAREETLTDLELPVKVVQRGGGDGVCSEEQSSADLQLSGSQHAEHHVCMAATQT